MRPIRWFGIILLLTILAIIFALFIPSDSPIIIIRFGFGFAYLAIIPGYCLVKLLFVKENRLDFPEEAVLSVALSFAVAGLTGLFLGLSPIGITFTSTLIAVSTVVIVLALFAFLRKRKMELREPQVQSTDSVSK